MHEVQSISLCQIYFHFFEPIDYLFLVLAIIGAIASGVVSPIIFCLSSENFNNIGNTSEISSINAPPHILQMILEQMHNSIRKNMNENIRRQLICGSIAFVSNFLSLTFWSLIGNRCIHKLKKSYFTLLLSQEQGWFDSFNTYELANKVLAQLEQVEQGIGIKIGITIFAISQCLAGIIASFVSNWKVTLVMICIALFYVILFWQIL